MIFLFIIKMTFKLHQRLKKQKYDIVIIITDRMIFTVLQSTARNSMKPYARVHFGSSESVSGGRHLVGQTANLTFEST